MLCNPSFVQFYYVNISVMLGFIVWTLKRKFPEVQQVSTAELQERLDSGSPVLLVDCRNLLNITADLQTARQ